MAASTDVLGARGRTAGGERLALPYEDTRCRASSSRPAADGARSW